MIPTLKRLLLKDINPFTPPKDAGPTDIDHARMVLEERIEWRTEMMYKTVRETMSALEVLGGMYRVKVSAVDVRHHKFHVMIDVSKSFAIGKRFNVQGFAGIEEIMCAAAHDRYGLEVLGVYWRTDDSINVFDIMRFGGAAAKAALGSQFEDTVPYIHDSRSKRRQTFEPISKEEEDQFREAIKLGLNPRVRIGDKVYDTDLASLE